MAKKIVGVFFGGQSAEHEISLLSATSIMQAIPKSQYTIVAIGIRKNGTFVYFPNGHGILNAHDAQKARLAPGGTPVTFRFGAKPRLLLITSRRTIKLDVAFPVLHGTGGEDGTIQGLLEMAGIPYVGAGVLGSAVGMDKDVTKRLWRDAGLPIADFLALRSTQKPPSYIQMVNKFGTPFFVKPAVAGSSVGVHRVSSEREYNQALADAFSYSSKVLVERMVHGVEIECAVLGDDAPEVSLPGAVKPTHDFYSYEAKYLDPNGATFEIPIRLPKKTVHHIQKVVRDAYLVLDLDGMARVDGFLSHRGRFTLNEVNTIPGFTTISMYPKLWEASGLPFSRLIERLLKQAIQRRGA